MLCEDELSITTPKVNCRKTIFRISYNLFVLVKGIDFAFLLFKV